MEILIERLKKVGEELNKKFGTESYELRCEIYDIQDALEKLHKPFVMRSLPLHNKDGVCRICGTEGWSCDSDSHK